jgi:hypothetical protein
VRTIAAVVAAAVLALAAPVALAHEGNPHFRSQVERITPPVEGVSVTVLNFDDRLLLRNASGRTVTILDYEDKPYARISADRTVEVNTNSKAYYLNDDRYAQAAVPKDLGSRPRWKLESRTGRFEWHDHRMHWMSPTEPPQVRGHEDRRTHIFDWKIPIEVGAQKGAIAGSLTWVPLDGGPVPAAAIWAFVVFVVLAAVAVVVVRRRRSRVPEPA